MIQQASLDGTTVAPIVLPSEFSSKTLAAASEDHGVQGDNDITMIFIPPFDAVYLSEDQTHVVWEKDFHYSGEKTITFEVFVEYLAYLMPELYNVSCDWRGNATLAWATEGADSLPLGESVSKLGSETLRLINGESNIDQLWDALYTEDNVAKIDALVRGTRLEADAIVQTLMNGHAVSLAQGEL